MTISRTIVGLLLLLPMQSQAQQINTDYRIDGDGAARPVQVFDDERSVYVQLRDPALVPAPLSAEGPLLFQVRGHYLVMPLVRSFRLQLGDSIVEVRGRGASRLPPGVVSMTRPVEAVDLPVVPVPVPEAALVRAQPAAVSQDEVTGEIEVGGSQVSLNNRRQVAIGAADAAIQKVLMDVPASTPIVVKADGTVAGVNAARRVVRVCEWAGRACSLVFKGADRGQVEVEPKA